MYLNGGILSVNPECRVLSIHHKFWVQALNLWRFISTLHFKLQHQIHVFEWGILKCGRIHILRSGIPNQIHGVLSVECWVSVISWGPGVWGRLNLSNHSFWPVLLAVGFAALISGVLIIAALRQHRIRTRTRRSHTPLYSRNSTHVNKRPNESRASLLTDSGEEIP